MFGENEIQSIHILFMSFILVIIYFVWKSTEVRREIQPIENIQHTFGVRRSSSIISNASTISTSTIEENLTNSVEELAQNIFSEASESYNNNVNSNRNSNDSLLGGRRTDDDVSDEELSEEERIIREMDRDLTPQLRNRRSHQRSSTTRDNEASTSTTTTTLRSDASIDESSTTVEDKISIKLKYLNDEIKTVECFLNESVGNFKRRNFKTELESKLIKLIFKGKLLEDDSKSIQQCGIFSEATVHCLIVQKKNGNINPAMANQNIGNGRNGASLPPNSSLINNFNIFGIFLVTLTLIFCWYCRVQYASYFSWYSTIGLILMTSLFIILIPLFSMVFS